MDDLHLLAEDVQHVYSFSYLYNCVEYIFSDYTKPIAYACLQFIFCISNHISANC